MHSAVADLDWNQLQQHRWWQPWLALGESVSSHVQRGAKVCDALNAVLQSQQPNNGLRFVPQSALPDGAAYELFIYETKTVPTRDNLHDFFNGLAWLRFPRTKARLNALQYGEISCHGVRPLRGALRDALTLFDENAAFLCSQRHAPVIQALRCRDWHSAFQTHRHLLEKHPPVLFGHALLEKLVTPYKSVVAHVFPTKFAIDSVSFDDLEALDERLCTQLCAAALQPKPFVPLPVLGVPHWWSQNESADFYADRTVFRPPAS